MNDRRSELLLLLLLLYDWILHRSEFFHLLFRTSLLRSCVYKLFADRNATLERSVSIAHPPFARISLPYRRRRRTSFRCESSIRSSRARSSTLNGVNVRKGSIQVVLLCVLLERRRCSSQLSDSFRAPPRQRLGRVPAREACMLVFCTPQLVAQPRPTAPPSDRAPPPLPPNQPHLL